MLLVLCQGTREDWYFVTQAEATRVGSAFSGLISIQDKLFGPGAIPCPLEPDCTQTYNVKAK